MAVEDTHTKKLPATANIGRPWAGAIEILGRGIVLSIKRMRMLWVIRWSDHDHEGPGPIFSKNTVLSENIIRITRTKRGSRFGSIDCHREGVSKCYADARSYTSVWQDVNKAHIFIVDGEDSSTTPLLCASRKGHTHIVNELLKMGADPDRAEPVKGIRALHMGATISSIPIMKSLI